MTVEIATYINQLNTAWPLAADLISEGDDVLRLIKTTIRNTFPNVAGAVSASHIELSYVAGVTSGIQGQINGKGAITGQTWSGAHVFGGTVTLPAATTVGTVTAAEIAYLSGVTSGIQAQINGKASLSGATYTGAHNYSGASSVALPANTSVGTVTAAELGYLDNVTSDIQGQFAGKATKAGDTYSGTHDFTSAVVRVPTLAAGSAGSNAASLDFVNAAAFSAVLPGQTGNDDKFLTTAAGTASWAFPVPKQVTVSGTSQLAVAGKWYLLANAALSTVTLPASGAAGDYLWVSCVNQRFDNVVARNGNNINSLAEDIVLDNPGLIHKFYWAVGYGWRYAV